MMKAILKISFNILIVIFTYEMRSCMYGHTFTLVFPMHTLFEIRNSSVKSCKSSKSDPLIRLIIS